MASPNAYSPLSPEEEALLQEALLRGELEQLPESLLERLEEDPALANRLVDGATQLGDLPTASFAEDGTLSDLGVSTYIDALRNDNVAELHPALRAHVEQNEASAARIVDAFIELEDLERPQQEDSPQKDAPRRFRRIFVATGTVAAAVLLFFVVNFLVNSGGGSGGADIATQNEAPNNQDKTAPETNGGNLPESAKEEPAIALDDEPKPAGTTTEDDNPAEEPGTPPETVGGGGPEILADAGPQQQAEAEDESIFDIQPEEAPEMAMADELPMEPENATRGAEARSNRARNQALREQQSAAPSAPGVPGFQERFTFPGPPPHYNITRIYTRESLNASYRQLLEELYRGFRNGELQAYYYLAPERSINFRQLKSELRAEGLSPNRPPDPVIEIVDGSPRNNQGTLFLRLRWNGPNGLSIIFPYPRLEGWLRNVQLPNPRNPAASLSAWQLLEAERYSGRPAYGTERQFLPDNPRWVD